MIHDISVYISEDIPVYSGDPNVEIISANSMDKGGSSNVSILKLGTHTGTHVDPPLHMIQGGSAVDLMPLNILIGDCFVCKMLNVPFVNQEMLEAADIPKHTERILFHTNNSNRWAEKTFFSDYTYLTPDGADWLVSHDIKLVGIDYLSIEQFHSGHHGAHLRLLEKGIVIIEGVDLRNIEQGIYQLICLPLRIKDGDGSPARAILIDK